MLILQNVSVTTASLRTTVPHETDARCRSGRDDRDLNERKARERRADRGRSSNRERNRDRDDNRRQESRKYDNKKGGGQGSRHNRARGSSQSRSSSKPRSTEGSKRLQTLSMHTRLHLTLLLPYSHLLRYLHLQLSYPSPYVRTLYLRMCNHPSQPTRLITYLVTSLLYSVRILKTR